METKVTTFNQDLTGIENLECRIEKYRRKKGRIMKKTGEKEAKFELKTQKKANFV